jgi:hypothetical protein
MLTVVESPILQRLWPRCWVEDERAEFVSFIARDPEPGCLPSDPVCQVEVGEPLPQHTQGDSSCPRNLGSSVQQQRSKPLKPSAISAPRSCNRSRTEDRQGQGRRVFGHRSPRSHGLVAVAVCEPARRLGSHTPGLGAGPQATQRCGAHIAGHCKHQSKGAAGGGAEVSGQRRRRFPRSAGTGLDGCEDSGSALPSCRTDRGWEMGDLTLSRIQLEGLQALSDTVQTLLSAVTR